ncbi:nucleolar complex protein 2 homolog [Contarinia nasturtii]|uniref:nucleolar complex protein 2 homolog n=1 Tax=Contarinia nasturtii TaxID=265458 RepID=UPI0012D3BABB|nr:nucleolar complex protein 2 homolog [Contarinia nasturtii]
MKTKKLNTKKVVAKPKWAEEDDVSDSANNEVLPEKKKKKLKKVIKTAKTTKDTKAEKVKKKSKNQSNNSSDDENYGASLDKLKEIDPEFYKFLEQNDKKLLKFNPDIDESAEKDEDSQSEKSDDDENENEENSDDDDEEKVHKPLAELDVASDESDFEDENNTTRKENSITLKLLKQWQSELAQDRVPLEIIKNVILALNSTLLTLAGETDSSVTAYQVEGAAAFNGVVQLCVLHLEPAIRRFLGLHQKTALQPHKCKKWNKIKSSLRGYFTDVTKLLEQVSSSNILVVLLKHIHQSIPMIISFTSLLKPILKRLVTIWSTGEETVRVLAFLCILRITRSQQMTVLSTVLKAMYLSYVRNSKFVSPNTMPAINFMRRSLSEMFALDLSVSYQHVFLYIRQLAIHLRNAMTLKKKESYQAVYNWQYINSIRLWSELLATTSDKAQLQPLIYPLVSIITGTIKLIPTAQYFPLRFHCIRALIQLSKETRTFIPVLPFILEVLKSNSFNQRHSKVSMKPLSFSCILRLNQNQLQENGLRDEVIENIVGCTLEYMAQESHTISYPDLAVPAIIQLKHYLKHGKNINSNYRSKLKLLVDKMMENSKYVVTEREKFTFELRDVASISAWEAQLRNKGTPLLTYYENWFNTNVAVQKRRATKSEDMDEFDLPKILKRKANSASTEKSDGPVDLFPSDEDEEELEVEKQPKKKKSKKQPIEQPKPVANTTADDSDNDSFADDGVDIVKDLDLDDW